MNAVPRLWPESTIVILANGPSLTQADVDACRGVARVIAIKDAVHLAPWADVLYGCGNDVSNWWHANGNVLQWYAGLRFTLDPKAAQWATVLKNTGQNGLDTDPRGLRTGKNSGYQAVNLAVHLGARRIVLLGFDMRPIDGKDHWFPRLMRVPNPYRDFCECFATIAAPIQARGIEVRNATPNSALWMFPKMTLADALRCEVTA